MIHLQVRVSHRFAFLPALALAAFLACGFRSTAGAEDLRTQGFDRDPGWDARNNRPSAETVAVRQDFGWSPTAHAGGGKGEIGGRVTAAAEPAYYARVIETRTFENPLSASGTFSLQDGGTHLLLGFFNAGTVNEWRTNNSVAIRINGRGDHFFAYVEYCTSKWRAGGDSEPFPAKRDLATGRFELLGFPSGGKPHRWSITYDPAGNNGAGIIKATIDDKTASCNLDAGHKAEGATFNRFGILNVMKSVDGGTDIFLDDIAIDGKTETFEKDPGWDGRGNRASFQTSNVRPRFDFGFTPTQHAGGKNAGELGGLIFRGDCRYPDRMACYGDRIGPLSLDKPIRASGKVAMRRGVSDSTTLFGFFNSEDSMRSNPSQSDGLPENILGFHIEGPSSEGFYFYPVFRAKGGNSTFGRIRECPRIYPDGARHDWTFEYQPSGASAGGRVTLTLDGKKGTMDLDAGALKGGARFDRFGIVVSWIDGNGQNVYFDDLTYTAGQ